MTDKLNPKGQWPACEHKLAAAFADTNRKLNLLLAVAIDQFAVLAELRKRIEQELKRDE